MHEASPQERSTSLYACALHGLILHPFDEGFTLALQAARSPTPMVSGPALHMLGLVDYDNPLHSEALERVIDLCAGIIRTPAHLQIETATRTLGRLLPSVETRVAPLLEEAAKTEAPEALYALSEVLFPVQEALRYREWFWPLYLRLAAAKAEHKGILDNVDMVLMRWIRHPEWQDRALEFLNAWIARQPLEVIRDAVLEKLFDATLHHLKEQPALLNRAVTAWLFHDDMRYPLVAFQVISRLREPGAKSVGLDPAIVDTLQPNEIRFLVRRILGFIAGDDAEIGLIFSLVRTRDAKTRTLGSRDGGASRPRRLRRSLPDHGNYLKERQAAEDDEDIRALGGQVIPAQRQQHAGALPTPQQERPSCPTGARVRSPERGHCRREKSCSHWDRRSSSSGPEWAGVAMKNLPLGSRLTRQGRPAQDAETLVVVHEFEPQDIVDADPLPASCFSVRCCLQGKRHLADAGKSGRVPELRECAAGVVVFATAPRDQSTDCLAEVGIQARTGRTLRSNPVLPVLRH